MTLTPAYGRDYKSGRAVLADFHANKDFLLADISSPWHGKPINKEQIPAGTHVKLRYARLRKVTTVKVPS